jgi:hypothetical protein
MGPQGAPNPGLLRWPIPGGACHVDGSDRHVDVVSNDRLPARARRGGRLGPRVRPDRRSGPPFRRLGQRRGRSAARPPRRDGYGGPGDCGAGPARVRVAPARRPRLGGRAERRRSGRGRRVRPDRAELPPPRQAHRLRLQRRRLQRAAPHLPPRHGLPVLQRGRAPPGALPAGLRRGRLRVDRRGGRLRAHRSVDHHRSGERAHVGAGPAAGVAERAVQPQHLPDPPRRPSAERRLDRDWGVLARRTHRARRTGASIATANRGCSRRYGRSWGSHPEAARSGRSGG